GPPYGRDGPRERTGPKQTAHPSVPHGSGTPAQPAPRRSRSHPVRRAVPASFPYQRRKEPYSKPADR
ncbi:hypothetical protein RYH73_26565, partial [Olivibacter sp. CPCC 100613]